MICADLKRKTVQNSLMCFFTFDQQVASGRRMAILAASHEISQRIIECVLRRVCSEVGQHSESIGMLPVALQSSWSPVGSVKLKM